jgi:hypothetical protein
MRSCKSLETKPNRKTCKGYKTLFTYEFRENAVVGEQRHNKSKCHADWECAPIEAEFVLQIFTIGGPILDELVLLHLHAARHGSNLPA